MLCLTINMATSRYASLAGKLVRLNNFSMYLPVLSAVGRWVFLSDDNCGSVTLFVQSWSVSWDPLKIFWDPIAFPAYFPCSLIMSRSSVKEAITWSASSTVFFPSLHSITAFIPNFFGGITSVLGSSPTMSASFGLT